MQITMVKKMRAMNGVLFDVGTEMTVPRAIGEKLIQIKYAKEKNVGKAVAKDSDSRSTGKTERSKSGDLL